MGTNLADVGADGMGCNWLCEAYQEKEKELGLGQRCWLALCIVVMQKRRLLIGNDLGRFRKRHVREKGRVRTVNKDSGSQRNLALKGRVRSGYGFK